jgi:hypothetical protein
MHSGCHRHDDTREARVSLSTYPSIYLSIYLSILQTLKGRITFGLQPAPLQLHHYTVVGLIRLPCFLTVDPMPGLLLLLLLLLAPLLLGEGGSRLGGTGMQQLPYERLGASPSSYCAGINNVVAAKCSPAVMR